MDLSEKKIKITDIDAITLLGLNDSNLKLIDKKFSSTITVRGDTITIRGESEEVKLIGKIFNEMVYIIRRNGTLETSDVISILELLSINGNDLPRNGNEKTDDVILYGVKDIIKAKTDNQKKYIKLVNDNDLVFAIGPAGTGKTYLAVAMAVAAYKNNEVNRIILSRPAVEAGESLGYLPGDMKEKLDPYMRPLTDALFQMIPAEKLKGMYEKNIIEITPLAYMRGRTLNNAFIILDEAQNATKTQMKMFLTRFGFGSKAVVTGDITQVDLADKSNCGLINATEILKNVKGIGFINFDSKDVVRHQLVARIVNAYQKNENDKFRKYKEIKQD